METYLLGIDNGGTASKAALFTPSGRQVAAASSPVPLSEPSPGWSERDPDQAWLATAALVRKVVAEAGIDASSIAAVACTGYGNGLYLIDSQGQPVRPAINSSDTRAQSVVEEWREAGVESQVRAWTAQQLWAAQPPPLLVWLRRHEPLAFARIRWILLCKDYTRFRLTGQVLAERTDYSGASLLHVAQGACSAPLLACFGLEEIAPLLPPLIDSHALAGRVTARAASETGLAAGTPVAGGMFDIDACCLSSGVLDGAHVAAVAGTWANCLSVSDQPVSDPHVFMTSCFCAPGKFLLLEGSPASAANLDWVLREFCIGSYREAEELASACVPAEGDPFFLPFLYGSHAAPEARSCFLGLRGANTRAQLVRSVYEGVCFAQRVHFDRLLRFRSAPASVRLTGGAARSAWWCQLFADTLGLPVEVPQGGELGAKGAAIAAALTAGLFPGYPEAVRSMTCIERRYEPRPEAARILHPRFERYRRLVTALHDLWPLMDSQPDRSA